MEKIIITLVLFLLICTPVYADLHCFPKSIEKTIYPGNTEYERIILWQEGTNRTNIIELDSLEENPYIIIDFSPSNKILLSDKINYVTAIIAISPKLGEGTYKDTIIAKNDFEKCLIPVSIYITKNFLMRMEIKEDYKIYNIGEDIFITITLEKIRGPPGLSDIILSYNMKDSKDNIIYSKTDTITVDKIKKVEYSLTIFEGNRVGEWKFEATARYEDYIAKNFTSFEVRESKAVFALEGFAKTILLISISIGFLVLSIGGTYFIITRNRKRKNINYYKDRRRHLLKRIKGQK